MSKKKFTRPDGDGPKSFGAHERSDKPRQKYSPRDFDIDELDFEDEDENFEEDED